MRTTDPVRVTLVDGTQRPWPAWATTALVLFATLLAGAGVWLFAASDLGELEPPPNLGQYAYVDGVVSRVEMPVLVLEAYESVRGERRLTLRVRDASLRYFDVVHLRAHSSIGLPTRIYYEDDGEQLWAVYKEDAPANSGGGG